MIQYEEEDEKLEFVDDFILDSDFFETREEYEKYLEEHGYEDDALIETGSTETASRKIRAKAAPNADTVMFTTAGNPCNDYRRRCGSRDQTVLQPSRSLSLLRC